MGVAVCLASAQDVRTEGVREAQREGVGRVVAALACYAAALAAGFYGDEILPIEALGPLVERGVVTTGNASGINDGAVALFIGSPAAGERNGVKPLARILAGAVSGVEPRIMGVGPAHPIPKALARAELTLADMDVIEINEAFAPQVLNCITLPGLAE